MTGIAAFGLKHSEGFAQKAVKQKMNRKAISPLIATILLVVFALVIGTITMNWGRAYVENIEEPKEDAKPLESAIIISIKDINTPLKELQIDHITGKLTEEEYLEQEKGLVS